MTSSLPHHQHASSDAAHREARPLGFISREEQALRRSYETLSILNDVLIGVIFLAGSFLFFSESTVFQGTVLFVIGSVLMLIRPTIRLSRRIHLSRRFPEHSPEAAHDF